MDYELMKITDRLINEILHIEIGETVVITADSFSDENVVASTAASAYASGAKPMIIRIPAVGGRGKVCDEDLSVDVLGAVLANADVWIEYNGQWMTYSKPFEIAYESNRSMRYINLSDVKPDNLMRIIGSIDFPILSELLGKVANMNRITEECRVRTEAGTDIVFNTNPRHIVFSDAGNASVPGVFMTPGQVSIVPKFSSVNGKLVFDGSLFPSCGLLDEPVELYIERSKIVKICGGNQARKFEKWLKNFDDPNMLKIAHMAYGLNPGAKLTGNITEDQRVWGCIVWGIGSVSSYEAPPAGQEAKSRCDGVSMYGSVWLNDIQILNKGRFIYPEFKKYEDKIMDMKHSV